MAEQRLPIVDSDDGQWGDVLNQFIEKEHYNTGVDNSANGGHRNVTLRPGSVSAGSAPLKFNSGSLLTNPEAGAIEFLNDKLYFTQTTGLIRKTVAVYDDISGATGDIYYRDSDTNFVRLPVGSNGQTLNVVGSTPSWTTMFSGFNTITVSTSAPSSPNIGDLWVDIN